MTKASAKHLWGEVSLALRAVEDTRAAYEKAVRHAERMQISAEMASAREVAEELREDIDA